MPNVDILSNKQILVVEDNTELQGILADFLEIKGANVDFADNGELGIQLALDNEFDAIILDVMLPKKDGHQVASTLRDMGCSTPILMLTALNGPEDLIQGFGSGADDFVTKPFNFVELEMRLSALIKRYRGEVASNIIKFGSLTIDQSAHKVTREGLTLNLTPVMYQLLVLLMKSAPDVVSRDALIHELWGNDVPDKDLLRGHIYLLRSVLDKPFAHPMLVTVPKLGFRLEK